MKLISSLLLLCLLFTTNCFAANTARVDGDFNINGNLYLNNTVFITPSTTILKDRGTFSGQNVYSAGDVVQYNGSSYVAKSVTSAAPSPVSSDWSVLAAQGVPGEAGTAGVAGATGPTGVAGATGISSSSVCGTFPSTVTTYIEDTTWTINSPATMTDPMSLLTYFPYPGGPTYYNFIGLNNNIGIKFTQGSTGTLGTRGGSAIFYFAQMIPDTNGDYDQNFSPIPIAGGKWKKITIDGKSAISVDTSAVRYAISNDIYFTYNTSASSIVLGNILQSPASTMAQTAPFSNLSGKSASFTFPASGTLTVNFLAGGSMTGTSTDGSSIPAGLTWAINGNGTLTAGPFTMTIVGGTTDNCRSVTYTLSMFSDPSKIIGPIAMKIF